MDELDLFLVNDQEIILSVDLQKLISQHNSDIKIRSNASGAQMTTKGILIAFLLVAIIGSTANPVSATIGVPTQEDWRSHYRQAMASFDAGCYSEAESHLFKSLDFVGSDFGKALSTLVALEQVLEETKKLSAKERVLLTHVKILDEHFKPCELQADVYLQLGELYSETDNFPNAEKYFRKTVSLMKQCYGPYYLGVGTALNNLAYSELRQKKLADAEVHFKQALVVFNKRGGEKNIFYGLTANNLGDLYEKTGRNKFALIYFGKAVTAFNSSIGSSHPIALDALKRYTSLRHKLESSSPEVFRLDRNLKHRKDFRMDYPKPVVPSPNDSPCNFPNLAFMFAGFKLNENC